jgi:hypothetical protein
MESGIRPSIETSRGFGGMKRGERVVNPDFPVR